MPGTTNNGFAWPYSYGTGRSSADQSQQFSIAWQSSAEKAINFPMPSGRARDDAGVRNRRRPAITSCACSSRDGGPARHEQRLLPWIAGKSVFTTAKPSARSSAAAANATDGIVYSVPNRFFSVSTRISCSRRCCRRTRRCSATVNVIGFSQELRAGQVTPPSQFFCASVERRGLMVSATVRAFFFFDDPRILPAIERARRSRALDSRVC